MKKRVLLMIIGVVAITIVITFVIFSAELKVGKFEFSDYRHYLEKFSSEENLGSISDAKDLLEKVEVIWIKKYGERIKNEKPYQVFYDEKNGIWLVQGTLRANMMGGVANILVENDTGKVLAVWHDK